MKIFVKMRRKIEEVNLFVSVFKHAGGLKRVMSVAEIRNGAPPMETNIKEGGVICQDMSRKMNCISLHLRKKVGKGQRGDTVNTPGNVGSIRLGVVRSAAPGIIIREMDDTGRLASPTCPDGAKGKGIQKSCDGNSDSDWDEAPTIGSLPLRHREAPIGETSRSVQRELFPPLQTDQAGLRRNVEPPPLDHSQCNIPSQFENVFSWGRFHEALNNILTDMGSDPVMFGRDVPPVVNDGSGEGNLVKAK